MAGLTAAGPARRCSSPGRTQPHRGDSAAGREQTPPQTSAAAARTPNPPGQAPLQPLRAAAERDSARGCRSAAPSPRHRQRALGAAILPGRPGAPPELFPAELLPRGREEAFRRPAGPVSLAVCHLAPSPQHAAPGPAVPWVRGFRCPERGYHCPGLVKSLQLASSGLRGASGRTRGCLVALQAELVPLP